MVQLRRLTAVILATAALASGLSGCVAIPPAVTLASLGIDLGSFALTGKTASDHMVSAVAGEDCRLAGILEGEICREEREFEAALAVLEPLPGDLQLAAGEAADATAGESQQLVAEASGDAAPPPGFTVPTGTVITEEPDLPIGGFSFGDGKGRALPERQTEPAAGAGEDDELLDLASYLSDDSMLKASNSAAARQLSEGLGTAEFLGQASLVIAASS